MVETVVMVVEVAYKVEMVEMAVTAAEEEKVETVEGEAVKEVVGNSADILEAVVVAVD